MENKKYLSLVVENAIKSEDNSTGDSIVELEYDSYYKYNPIEYADSGKKQHRIGILDRIYVNLDKNIIFLKYLKKIEYKDYLLKDTEKETPNEHDFYIAIKVSNFENIDECIDKLLSMENYTELRLELGYYRNRNTLQCYKGCVPNTIISDIPTTPYIIEDYHNHYFLNVKKYNEIKNNIQFKIPEVTENNKINLIIQCNDNFSYGKFKKIYADRSDNSQPLIKILYFNSIENIMKIITLISDNVVDTTIGCFISTVSDKIKSLKNNFKDEELFIRIKLTFPVGHNNCTFYINEINDYLSETITEITEEVYYGES